MQGPRVMWALALAATMVAGLAACTQTAESGTPADDCVAPATGGDAANLVSSTGAFGVAADATFPAPLRSASLEVVVEGSGIGAPITEHGVFTASLQLFDASTGEALGPYTGLRAGADGAPAPVTLEAVASQLPGIADSLRCAQEGERIVAVMPTNDLVGGDEASGLAAQASSVVAIADVQRVYPSSAAGTVLGPQDGFPSVVAAPSGQPGVTMPQQPPPAQQASTLRVQGYGPRVEDGDALTIHASVFSWDSGAEVASSWDESNSVLQVAAVGSGPADDGLFGATSALTGVEVGSQVIVIVPAEQAAQFRGPVAPSPGAGGSGALVLVVDILAADAPGERA